MLSGIIKSVGLGATIQTAELDNDSVTAAKIADDAVGSEHIEDLSADLTFGDEVDIVFNTTTGTKIGTATGQKIGFFNAAPVVQAAHITNGSDAASTQSAVNAVLVVLENLGLTASS